MDCDCVHVNIESKAKDLEVYDPNSWYTTVRMAWLSDVPERTRSDFYNFKKLQKKVIKNIKFDTEKNSMQWVKINGFCVKKGDI